jgi:hypothetical protein
MCASDKLWWVLALSHLQELEKYVKIKMDPHAFVGLGLSHSVLKADFCVIVGIYTGQENHVVPAIVSWVSLKAQIAKLFGGIAFIIILERIS